MSRFSTKQTNVTVATAVGDSDEIPYGDFEKGMVFVPSGSSITGLTWHATYDEPDGTGTYSAAYNEAGTAPLTQSVNPDRAYPIPPDLKGARAIKVTGDVAGTVHVSLKE